jgi:hypothetical protein
VESVRAVETDHKVTWADKENALLNGFRTIADEIAAGYADGTRIRYNYFMKVRTQVFSKLYCKRSCVIREHCSI